MKCIHMDTITKLRGFAPCYLWVKLLRSVSIRRNIIPLNRTALRKLIANYKVMGGYKKHNRVTVLQMEIINLFAPHLTLNAWNLSSKELESKTLKVMRNFKDNS